MRFPSQAQKKNTIFVRFQIEDIGIIFQRFPSQAQKKENPVFKQKILALFSRKAQKDTEIPSSNEVPITSPEKHGNSVFKYKILALFSRGCHHKPKKREIPFSNRRYWHYFPEKPKKTRKSCFQMRFPSQAQKNGNSVFKQKILELFSRGSHHKPKKREIPFSNRRYWHYFPEVPITSPKKGKSRFQIEDIGIIFQKSPKRHGNPVFK